jgi:hypothetical protein
VVGAPKSVWEDTDPDSAFITIAPMHMREAFWTKISRPIRGIMYHGWQSLVPTDSTGGYRYTHPQTQHELRRLVKSVVEPLGPTLLQVPDRKSDVAFLESFASQMFARRGTYGWGHTWLGDAYLVLLYAKLQPEIVYDETIIARGLDGFKVLAMMDCDVITEAMLKKIKEFQDRGGIIIGDERLTPAIKPYILVQSYDRIKKADEDKAALLARAAVLRHDLDSRYQRHVDSSDANVVTRCRSYGKADYLFAVNDSREFGDYVGHHGLVMENGLPSEAVLSIRRQRGYVYDLVAAQPVNSKPETRNQEPVTSVSVQFGPSEGRLFMITDQAIDAMRLEGPETVPAGKSATCKITIVDNQARAISAVIPVRVDILDPTGREAEFTGFYGAKDGQLEICMDIAPNDAPGIWTIHVKELASGLTADHYFRVFSRSQP